MPNEPKLHNVTFWVNVRSLFQWIIGGTFFLFSALLLIVGTYFVSPYRLDPLLHFCIRVLTWILRADVRVHGLEKIDPQKPYLFVFNHINQFDHFFVYLVLKRRMRGVEKEAHFRWPIYGSLIRRMGTIPIPPKGNTQRAILALARLRSLFEQGISIAVLPEGTRSVDGKLQPFKKGAFYLAVQSGATIVPMTLVGAYAFNKKGDWRIYPGVIDIYIEDPVPTQGLTEKDAGNLRDQVRSVIENRLNYHG